LEAAPASKRGVSMYCGVAARQLEQRLGRQAAKWAQSKR